MMTQLSIFEFSTVLNPNFAQAYNNLGTSYKRIRNGLEGGEDFDKVLAIKPDYVQIKSER